MKQRLLKASPWVLLKTTFEEWNMDNASRLAAALAYYTIFSMAPLLVIAVGLAGIFLGREAVQGQLAGQIESFLANADAAALLQETIRNTSLAGQSWSSTIVGVALLFWGAAGVFGELKSALNHVWDVPPNATGLRGALLTRLLTLLMVLLSGLVLFVSLVANTLLTSATRWIDEYWWRGMATWSHVINFIFLFVVTLSIFVLIYKYLPDLELAWRDVWAGAIATALIFSIGRLLISLYLGYSSISSVWGAAGSFAALLIWVYYSAQIFLLGAEFTQVYARTYGSRRREHNLLEQTAPGGVVPTVETDSGTIVALPAAPIPAEQTSRKRWRRVVEPVATVGTALVVIVALSLLNLMRLNRTS